MVATQLFKGEGDPKDSLALVSFQSSSSREYPFEMPTSVKRELKLGAQLKSPFVNDFGSSSEPVEKPKKKQEKRKMKDLFAFFVDLFAEVDRNWENKLIRFINHGVSLKNK
ncbi:hypothetical protein PanWU01x14_319310 [Parasponia andersonii]|uniref:Uncharacterized protein n=1 Tax=Parasponia andersonii TaxID=3476 RepID=A0A2P5ALX9_PARAD|nr:hypothetical protein PanWU01x14_319310 [Parasponia andersonii]